MQTIYVVSTGPGGYADMSVAAKETIEKSDVVVGYTKYLKDKDRTIDDICRIVGISRATLYKYLKLEGVIIEHKKK